MTLPPDDTPIADLKNLGTASIRMLSEIDVHTAGQIRTLGVDLIYTILKGKGTSVSMNLVYAMQAAIEGRHWHELSKVEQQQLRKACTEPSP